MASILITCQPRSDWTGPTTAPEAAEKAAAATPSLDNLANCSRVCGPTEMSAAEKPAGLAASVKLPVRARATIASAWGLVWTTAWLITRRVAPPKVA